MATLLLIRHGQASYGEADYDRLSARGAEQARALGSYLAGAKLDALYSGPLRRQVQTAEMAREGRELPTSTVIPELAEYPAFEMLQHLVPRLVAEDARFAALTSGPTPKLLDDAFHTVLGRWSRDEWAVPGLERVLRDAESGGRAAVVTSAGPIGVAVGLVFGIAEERMVRTSIVIRNASITELRFRSRTFAWHPDQISLVTFNLTSHLPDELQTER